MKHENIVFCLLLIFAFNLSSCRKVATYVDPPEFSQKLVINAYLSPDKLNNRIFISSNERRFGELTGLFEPFGNASLYIYENAKEIEFDTVREPYFGSGYNYWIRNFKFKEGQTYNLKVISDIGLEAEATCKIPLRRDFLITVDTSSIKNH